jgi:DNA-binding response OmpR family regulator/cellulose synthase/poly-beta-1,6-N-acetylglucosamine synthase-like glycosyltransferase
VTGNGTSILAVDDDVMIRDLLEAILGNEGYDVHTAASGDEALAYLGRETPRLVISDVMMPEMDGFTLISRLRSESTSRNIPVLFLTSHMNPTDDETGLHLASGDFLRKPFTPQLLLHEVESHLAADARTVEDMLAIKREPLTDVDTLLSTWRPIRSPHRRAHTIAVLQVDERLVINARFGARGIDDLTARLVPVLRSHLGPDVAIGLGHDGTLACLIPERSPSECVTQFGRITRDIVHRVYAVAGEKVTITPHVGLASLSFESSDDVHLAYRHAQTASVVAASQLDLEAVVWEPEFDTRVEAPAPSWRARWWSRVATPFQILVTLMLGTVGPFFIYQALFRLGFDVAGLLYVIIVIALALTGAVIWMEGIYALRPITPPDEPSAPPPPATAIIAAYLPNEAATILDTVESFLRVDYPDLQVLVAYNTPRPLLVEDALMAIAERDRRFTALRVEGSTSKAQNVNAALRHARGEFVGLFDADHHPQPDSFTRAWRWLSNGYDVVQGHCVIRNGDVSTMARTVAVEFEAIYAVSHPGRAQLHGFGIFGGSNGFWRTEVLRRTRMRGFMLTEDIDSSLRVVKAGGRIANDPALISRELAPTTWSGLWNQRMRWAQGWFQVSREHLHEAWLSRTLTMRQKVGMTFLLGWRELYPWISFQMIPLVAFIAWRDGGLSKLDWLIGVFVLTTLFTMSVGPGQTILAHRLAAPDIRKHTAWFWAYLAMATLFYTEWKNTIARVAQIKEVMGDRQWKVTSRAAKTTPTAVP